MLSNVGRSFSTRLSIWVTGLVTVVFGVALVMMFRFSQSVVASESVERDMQTLESVALQVDHVLHQTEITARITGSLVRKSLATPDSIPVICSQAARTAPWIERCYVTPSSSALQADTARGWYNRELDTPADSVPLRPMTVSYRTPVTDGSGRPAGVLVVDVSIDWADYASAIKAEIPYASLVLQGEGGMYRMAQGGYRKGDGDCYVFYRPFYYPRWGLALISPEDKILASYHRLEIIALILTVFGLVLLLILCHGIIDHHLAPLDKFSDTVRHISHGAWEQAHDPGLGGHDQPSGRHDEIGELQHSFARMQQALAGRIKELHQTTENLTQRNSELLRAYERGKEDERAKTLFLNNASSRLLPPVQAISDATARLGDSYQRLEKSEMTDVKTEITSHSETITALTDQMLAASRQSPANTTILSAEGI